MALISLALLFLTLIGGLIFYTWDRGEFVKGISIAQINVGGRSKAEAQNILETQVNRWLNKPLQFKVVDDLLEISPKTLGATLNISPVLDKAYAVGHDGFLVTRARDKFMAARNGLNFDLMLSWDEETLTSVLGSHFNSYNRPMVNADYTFNGESLDVTSEQIGRSVNISELIQHLNSLEVFHDKVIIVPIIEEKPSLYAKDLLPLKRISSYTTWFNPYEIERSENVRLATLALDRTLIEPGGIISFNEIVGKRTRDKGYKDALIIVDGEFTPGLAGGICQVSSTLYNTGLYANLPIIERTNHELIITYIPMGQDAAVAYGIIDLKMKNDTDGYMIIHSKVSNNSITIDLYGLPSPGQEVVITNSTNWTSTGAVTTTNRIVKKDGVVVKTEPLGNSYYKG